MAEPTAVIEMIKRIIADDTADLRERLQHLEQRLNHEGVHLIKGVNEYEEVPGNISSMESPTISETINALQDRLEKIKAIHRLDATPVQWTRDNTGKMVEAPDGLWEIQCVVCKDVPPIVWRSGDPKPPQCETWRLADGS